MPRLSSRIIGEDPKVTRHYQPETKRKIALFATCMMVPVILWFFNGFFLVGKIMEGGWVPAILAGVVVAFIVFLIERSIILSNGHPVIGIARVILGVAIAFVGSICLDEVIFEHDIDNQVETYRSEFVENYVDIRSSDQISQLEGQSTLVTGIRNTRDQTALAAMDEADGTGGSGKANVGEIAEFKGEMAAGYTQELAKEMGRLSDMQGEVSAYRDKLRGEANEKFNPNGLLIRVRAMFDLVRTDKGMMWFYIAITLLLFMTEFLVVLAKFCSKETIDEKLEKRRNRLMDERSRALLERLIQQYRPEEDFDEVRSARELAEQLQVNILPSSN